MLSPMTDACYLHLVPFAGVYAVVDSDVFSALSHYRWYKKNSVARGQRINVFRFLAAPKKNSGKSISMHRCVLDFYGLKWVKIIHINGDGLDNRLCNLKPEFSILEYERRANAIREYQKAKAIRDYWLTYRND